MIDIYKRFRRQAKRRPFLKIDAMPTFGFRLHFRHEVAASISWSDFLKNIAQKLTKMEA